ncbi:hypothetical protein IW262DRAFT_1365316 [Armillaria fumosa]|nr:hypothetical protein IW262DRAFT_1365316 [Armillaria fumosa]
MACHNVPAGYYPPQGPQRPPPCPYGPNPPPYQQSNGFATPYAQQTPFPVSTPQYSYRKDPPNPSPAGRPSFSSPYSNPQTMQSAPSSIVRLSQCHYSTLTLFALRRHKSSVSYVSLSLSMEERFIRFNNRQNEEVQVQIEGRKWVIGIIISVLSLFDKMGYGYKVKYTSTNGRWKEGAFPVDHIQPMH